MKQCTNVLCQLAEPNRLRLPLWNCSGKTLSDFKRSRPLGLDGIPQMSPLVHRCASVRDRPPAYRPGRSELEGGTFTSRENYRLEKNKAFRLAHLPLPRLAG